MINEKHLKLLYLYNKLNITVAIILYLQVIWLYLFPLIYFMSGWLNSCDSGLNSC